MAVFAKGYGGKPLPLFDFVGIARAWGFANCAGLIFDALDVSGFGEIGGALVFGLHHAYSGAVKPIDSASRFEIGIFTPRIAAVALRNSIHCGQSARLILLVR